MKQNVIRVTIGLILGVLFLLIWAHLVDIEDVVSSIRNLNIYFVLISIFSYILAYFLRSVRWNILLKPVVTLSTLRAYLIVMAGHFTNYFIPLKAGELMKAYFVRKFTGVRMSQTIPVIFIDKLYDTSGVLLVLILLPFLPIKMSHYLEYLMAIIITLIVVALILLIAIISNKEVVIRVLQRLFCRLPLSIKEKVNEIIRYFVDGVALYKDHKYLIFPLIMLSLLIVLCDSIFFYLMFLAFGKQVSYLYVLFGYTLIYLSFIIPHPPAQIGSNELLMVLIFAVGFGMNRDLVSGIMVFAHLITGMILILLGTVSYSYAGIKLITIFNRGDDFNE